MSGRLGRSVRVTGLVQGVFFRAWAAEQARTLGVAGWIRNAPDGSVEAHLAGEESGVSQLIERLRSGPPGAEVDRLDVKEVPPETGDRFEIRH
jgi:acylphosphatase